MPANIVKSFQDLAALFDDIAPKVEEVVKINTDDGEILALEQDGSLVPMDELVLNHAHCDSYTDAGRFSDPFEAAARLEERVGCPLAFYRTSTH